VADPDNAIQDCRKAADLVDMFASRRSAGYLALPVAVLTGLLLAALQVQRDVAVRAAARTESAVDALTAMLDQETGLRGFMYTGQEVFLQPYIAGQAAYTVARTAVIRSAAGDQTSVRLAAAEDSAARTWQSAAAKTVATRRAGIAVTQAAIDQALTAKAQMDRFRSVNSSLRDRLNYRRDATLREASIISTLAVVH